MHKQNVKDFLMCKRNVDLTSTEFYGNIKFKRCAIEKDARHK